MRVIRHTCALTLLGAVLAFPSVASADYRSGPIDRARAVVERAECDVRDAQLALRNAVSHRDAIAVQLRDAQRHGGRIDDLRRDLDRAERSLVDAEHVVATYTQEARTLDRLLAEKRAFDARCIDRYANEREIGRLRYELEQLECELDRGHGYGFDRADILRRIDRVRFELRVRSDSERNIYNDLRRAQDVLADAERTAERYRCDVRDLRSAIADCGRFDVHALSRDYARAEQCVDDARCALERAESNHALAVRDYQRAEHEWSLARRDDRAADRFYGRSDGGYENGRRPRERYSR